MEPIQLQCGSCGQMMAVSPEHLGAQVHCPHCRAIVQTPSRSVGLGGPPASQPAPPPLPISEKSEQQESIFSQPEPTDDLFGGSTPPRIEMPPEVPPQPALLAGAPTIAMEMSSLTVEQAAEPPPAAFAPSAAPAPVEDELASFTPQRRVEGGSLFVPILLIFLVPYAIFATAVIGYLLYIWPKEHRLRQLPDDGAKGKAREQVKHDLDLDQNMKTALGQPIRVGAIEVTPLQVKHTAGNDLVLVFKAKNISPNLVFNPISPTYMDYRQTSMASARPYTFLERVGDPQFTRLYGGDLEWFQGQKQVDSDMEIGPGEEAVIHLTSELKYRKREVTSIVKAKEPLLWRIQVRRGLVPADDGKLVSATTVIGIVFTARDIVKDDDEG